MWNLRNDKGSNCAARTKLRPYVYVRSSGAANRRHGGRQCGLPRNRQAHPSSTDSYRAPAVSVGHCNQHRQLPRGLVQSTISADVRFGSKSDIAVRLHNVRFTPNSGHWNSVAQCPLCAKSGGMSHARFGSKADIVRDQLNVRFTPEGRHSSAP